LSTDQWNKEWLIELADGQKYECTGGSAEGIVVKTDDGGPESGSTERIQLLAESDGEVGTQSPDPSPEPTQSLTKTRTSFKILSRPYQLLIWG